VSVQNGIRTIYAGTWFRSRLEARWAALMDTIGWAWEYEPFDLDGYIPDFLVLGRNPLLVEVKPAASLDELGPPLLKAERAVRAMPVGEPLLDVLAVGASVCLTGFTAGRMLQWLPDAHAHGSRECEVGNASWFRCQADGCARLGVHHTTGSFRGYTCGHHDGDHHLGPVSWQSDLEPIWATARNVTQWQPGVRS
jgi:hypothetical protein